jgi:hypothetical protein
MMVCDRSDRIPYLTLVTCDVIGHIDIQWKIVVIFVVKAKNPIVSFLGNQVTTGFMVCNSQVTLGSNVQFSLSTHGGKSLLSARDTIICCRNDIISISFDFKTPKRCLILVTNVVHQRVEFM